MTVVCNYYIPRNFMAEYWPLLINFSVMEQVVKILSIKNVTHNVKAFRLSKPAGFRFAPGQATDLSINKPGWEQEVRPFTFTSLNEWDHLEFTIKIYSDHSGVTNELNKLVPGDELIIR